MLILQLLMRLYCNFTLIYNSFNISNFLFVFNSLQNISAFRWDFCASSGSVGIWCKLSLKWHWEIQCSLLISVEYVLLSTKSTLSHQISLFITSFVVECLLVKLSQLSAWVVSGRVAKWQASCNSREHSMKICVTLPCFHGAAALEHVVDTTGVQAHNTIVFRLCIGSWTAHLLRFGVWRSIVLLLILSLKACPGLQVLLFFLFTPTNCFSCC